LRLVGRDEEKTQSREGAREEGDGAGELFAAAAIAALRLGNPLTRGLSALPSPRTCGARGEEETAETQRREGGRRWSRGVVCGGRDCGLGIGESPHPRPVGLALSPHMRGEGGRRNRRDATARGRKEMEQESCLRRPRLRPWDWGIPSPAACRPCPLPAHAGRGGKKEPQRRNGAGEEGVGAGENWSRGAGDRGAGDRGAGDRGAVCLLRQGLLLGCQLSDGTAPTPLALLPAGAA
jgi:hypothetical protein